MFSRDIHLVCCFLADGLKQRVTKQAMCEYRNIEARSLQPVLQWKSNKYHPLCVCVCVVLGTQREMRRIIFSSVASPSLLHFLTLSHKLRDFRKNNY